MFHQNPQHTGRSSCRASDRPLIAWSYRTTDNISSSPVISNNGRVFVSSRDNHLYALYSTGTLAWSYETNADITASNAIGTDGRVYVGTHSPDEKFYSFNSDGTLAWSYWGGVASGFFSSPVITGANITHVGSLDNRIYTFAYSGSLEWSYETNNAINSSPALNDVGQVIVGSNDWKLYAINQAGTFA